MKSQTLSQAFWGQHAKMRYLYLAAAILFFTSLGARELWTQEHRWADILTTMFQSRDFLHPYLDGQPYYDKPLLSYWLMAILSYVLGGVNTLALRLPSALAGVLALWSLVQIGTFIKDRSLGLLAGWLFITTYYILFWGRVSSADMLNVAGILFATAWYLAHRESHRFFDYFIFFLTLALTSLCKGLSGAVVPVIAVLVDVILHKNWRSHLRLTLVYALISAMLIYFLPFWASSHFGGSQYAENGLYLVYRENILRYFQPFDHQGPIYTYLIYLPIYLLPWTVFFIPALIALPSRIKHGLKVNQRWLNWTFLLVFLFFTLSGSRRSYYVLPMVPFALLFTADWVLSHSRPRLQRWLAGLVIGVSVLLWALLDIMPAWYALNYGLPRFKDDVKSVATRQMPWEKWNIVLLDAETKVNFYFNLAPATKNDAVIGERTAQTRASLLARFPEIQHLSPNTIYITRAIYMRELMPYFEHYRLVMLPVSPFADWFKHDSESTPIAFIPLSIHD